MKKYLKIEHIIIFILSLVGLALRLNMVNNIPTTQLYDFESYFRIADSVFRGMGFQLDGYPIAFQGMGYSMGLGFWFKIFGESTEILAKYFNVIMSMLTIYLVYYILHKVTKSKAIILASTITVIFLPHHIAYCNAIGSEVMSVFLLTLVMAIQVTSFNYKFKYPLLGFVIGALALTKPFFIAYPLIIAMIIWMQEKDYKEALKLLIITFIAMAIVIAPWTYRNYKKFDRFIPVSYNSGFNLYINNNENNIHGGWQSFEDIYKSPELQAKINQHLDNPLKSVKIASDIELDFKPAAKEWIFNNPVEFFKLGVIRIHSTYFNGAWDIEHWTMNDYKEEQLKTGDEYLIGRQMNFNKSVYDICLNTISVFGLWFIILNFKNMVFGLFNKKKLDGFKVLIFMNLSFVSLVYFVYEGQPRYNFMVLFLLIFATAEMVHNYLKKEKSI